MNVDNLFFCWSAWHTAEAYAIYLTGNNNKQNAESTFTLLSAQFIAPKGFATIHHHHNHNNNTVSSFLSVEVYSVCCDVSVILTEREVHCLSRVTCTFSFSLLEEVEIFLNEHYYNTSNNNNDNDPDGLFLFDHVCEGKSLLFKDYAVLSHLFHRLHHPDNNNTNNSGYCFHGSGQQLQCYLAPNSLVLRESLLVRLYAAPIAVEDTNRLQTLILPKRTTPTVLWSAVKDSFFSVWKNMNLDEDNDDNNDRSIPPALHFTHSDQDERVLKVLFPISLDEVRSTLGETNNNNNNDIRLFGDYVTCNLLLLLSLYGYEVDSDWSPLSVEEEDAISSNNDKKNTLLLENRLQKRVRCRYCGGTPFLEVSENKTASPPENAEGTEGPTATEGTGVKVEQEETTQNDTTVEREGEKEEEGDANSGEENHNNNSIDEEPDNNNNNNINENDAVEEEVSAVSHTYRITLSSENHQHERECPWRTLFLQNCFENNTNNNNNNNMKPVCFHYNVVDPEEVETTRGANEIMHHHNIEEEIKEQPNTNEQETTKENIGQSENNKESDDNGDKVVFTFFLNELITLYKCWKASTEFYNHNHSHDANKDIAQHVPFLAGSDEEHSLVEHLNAFISANNNNSGLVEKELEKRNAQTSSTEEEWYPVSLYKTSSDTALSHIMTLCQSVLTSPQKNNEKKEKEELAAICHKKTQLLDSVMRFGVSSITQTNSNNNTLQSLRKFNAVYRKMRHQEESEREEEKKSMKRKKTEQYLEETFFPSLSVLLYDHPENNNNPNNAPMSAEQRKLLEYTLQRVTYNKETHLQEWKKRTEPPTTHNNNNNTKVDPTTPSNTIPNPKQNVAHPHTANPPPLQNNNNTSNNYYQNASAKKATEPTPTSLNYYQNTPANHNPPSPSTVAPKPVMKSVLNPNATPYRYSDNNSNNNNSVFNTSNEEAWDSSGIIDTPSHNNNTSGGSILQTPSPSPPILTKQQLREQRFGTASPSHSRPVIPTGGSILHTSSGSSMGRPTGSVLASTNDTNSNNNHSRGVLGRGQSQGGHRGRGRGGRRGH